MAYFSDEQLRAYLVQGLDYLINQTISPAQFNRGLQELELQHGKSRIDNIYKQAFLEVYTKLVTPKKETFIYNYNTPSYVVYDELKNFFPDEDKKIQQKIIEEYKKIIDIQPQIDYKTPQDQLEEKEAPTMRGTDYIRQARGPKAYTHMRRMLQEIWNLQYKNPEQRFDIDLQFKYDSYHLSSWIVANASDSEINQAHQNVIATYKKRGRPPGARNRNTITPNTISDPLADVSDIETIDVQEQDNAPQQPSQQVNEDLSKYVTHPQLNAKAAELRNDFIRATQAIQDALQPEFERLEDKINNIQLHQPTLVEIKVAELPKVDLGVQHRMFPTLLKICSARLRNGNRIIPWVYGPAGTGKSTAAENVAKALSLPFYSLGKTLAKFEILGFVNVSGYQSTEFRNAYENGGVFCADEMDAWSPEATVALNGALANGHCAFPDKSVRRHKDFIMITCANTTGSGATMDYVGRNKQDAATLDRFVSLFWGLDEALEDSMVANKDWLAYVRHVRAKVATSGINPKPIISPRASIHGESLLFAGLDHETVVDMCLRKGLSDAQWNMIR